MPASSDGSPQRRIGVRMLTHATNSALSSSARVHLGREIAGRDRVDADAVRRELDGESARQLPHAALRRRRTGTMLGRASSLVSDAMLMMLPRPRCCMPRARRLRDQERRGQVGGDHRVPVVLREIADRVAALDAGVVDDDVERAVLAPRSRRCRRAPRRCCVTSNTALSVAQRRGRASPRALSSAAGVAAVVDDGGAGLREAAPRWRRPGRARRR